MTRQVRLDDDVVALVDARSDGLSLSGTTNRLLRSLLAEPTTITPRRARISQDRRGRRTSPIDRPDGPRPLDDATERLVEADGPEVGAPIVSDVAGEAVAPIDRTSPPKAPGVTRVRRAKRFGGGRFCPHPEELRVGRRCAQCGRVFVR